MPKRIKSLPAVRFRIGDKVRVRLGATDNDYPDMPIGGWAGTVLETRDGNTHVVRWSKETLTSIHPVFKNRCRNDGLDFEQYSIGADDLELDTGGPLNIEEPQQITTRPLSPKEQDDRIRMIFGLTSTTYYPTSKTAHWKPTTSTCRSTWCFRSKPNTAKSTDIQSESR